MHPKFKDDDELIEECEVKKRILERGYAFIQIQLANGEWATIGTTGSFRSAQQKMDYMQTDMTRRNHRMYHFRVR